MGKILNALVPMEWPTANVFLRILEILTDPVAGLNVYRMRNVHRAWLAWPLTVGTPVLAFVDLTLSVTLSTTSLFVLVFLDILGTPSKLVDPNQSNVSHCFYSLNIMTN